MAAVMPIPVTVLSRPGLQFQCSLPNLKNSDSRLVSWVSSEL